MQPIERIDHDKVHRYCCSNPNCKKVFSKPKIIKYYVCPRCQTIVDMTLDSFTSIAQEKTGLEKKPLKLRKQKKCMEDESQEPKAIEIQQITAGDELTSIEEPEVKEIPEKMEPSQMEEPNLIEVTLDKKHGLTGSDYDLPFELQPSNEQHETVKEEKSSPGGFPCPYFFGYLSQRDKEEVIPETCFGCLKSIECMMFEYNKPKETVEEIKKWYSFKL